MDVGDHHLGIYRQFGLEMESYKWSHGRSRTHVKDMKDLHQFQPPCRDRVLVVLCVEMSCNYISFALLDDPRLDRRHGSKVGSEPS